MAFTGWPEEAIEFYEGLEADNSKAYWTDHKAAYEEKVRAPMVALVAELEPEFGDGKIFRPYRDVRFSKDKAPYKTNIGAWFDRGAYVQLSAQGLAAGAGMYQMTPEQLDRYRRAVDADDSGEALVRIVADAAKLKISVTGHERLKNAPRGYPRDHPRADLLRNKDLVAWKEWAPAAWLGTAKAKAKLLEFLRQTEPMNAWLDKYVGRSGV